MDREMTIKITIPNESRITTRQVLDHIKAFFPGVSVKLLHSISAGGPTLEELRMLAEGIGERLDNERA